MGTGDTATNATDVGSDATQWCSDAETENIIGRITVIGYPRTFLQGKETFQMETYERLIV